MARVLVTGGTGTLGSRLVPKLAARGHEVRSLSRHPSDHSGSTSGAPGISQIRGDVQSGEGLGDACVGVDCVIHTATSPRASRIVEIEGTANVMTAATEVGAHLIYISIVGVDSMRYPYYRGKWEAEQIVESGGAPWTIQRATQFHDLLDRFFGWRVFPVTKHMTFQPCDTAEVAGRLAELVDEGPSGRAEDFGGPAVVPVRELVATRRAITGSGTFLLPMPAFGAIGEFDQGRHLCPDHARGKLTWEEWLENRAAADS